MGGGQKLTVGSLVLVQPAAGPAAPRPAMLLVQDGDGGSWDVDYDDEAGGEECGIPPNRITRAPRQRFRPDPALVDAAARVLQQQLAEERADQHAAAEGAAPQLAAGGSGGPDGRTEAFIRLQGAGLGRRHLPEAHMAAIAVGSGPPGWTLWLGDAKAATKLEWLQARGITAVCNATVIDPNVHEHRPEFLYHTVRVEDTEAAAAAMDGELDAAVAFVARCAAAGRNVLVHCHAGRSRSATVVLAYLMRADGVGLRDALHAVGARRTVLPNAAFLELLAQRDPAAAAATGAPEAGGGCASDAAAASGGSPAAPVAYDLLRDEFVAAMMAQPP